MSLVFGKFMARISLGIPTVLGDFRGSILEEGTTGCFYTPDSSLFINHPTFVH
jgi:hypothetical protein